MTDRAAVARGLDLSRAIAGRANANFLHAARLLPRVRQDFFFATYAAMRVIDDLVDEGFLSLPRHERDSRRAGILAEIEQWTSQCTAFGSEPGPLHPDIVAALEATAGRSDLGGWPWTALAGTMRADAEEREMRSWDDFLNYCSGATVAPAAIFVYLLAAEPDAERGFRYGLAVSARDHALDLAIYCYIVHILRDLAKDAARSARLITIPAEILEEAGLSRAGLGAALSEKSPAINRLAARLIAKAEPYRQAGHAALHVLATDLALIEKSALFGLIAIYDRLFERARKNALSVALEGPAMELELRRDLLKPGPDGDRDDA